MIISGQNLVFLTIGVVIGAIGFLLITIRLFNSNGALTTRIHDLERTLKLVEFEGSQYIGKIGERICPYCRRTPNLGHSETCAIGNVLGKQ